MQVVPTVTLNQFETQDPFGLVAGDSNSNQEFGLSDVRWNITPDFTFNATLNPDFSQIEADIAQSAVNESFVLFYPERRPFFLEGRDLFVTDMRLVNTRNISDPDWGAKLTGKVGSNVYGLITAQDSVTNYLLASNEQVFAGSAFDLSELSIDFSTRPVRGINYLARFTGGNQIDFANVQRGDQLSFSHFLGYNITQHLLVNLSQTFQILDVPGGELFRTVLTDLRFSYLFSRASFFRISLIHQATRRNSELYEFAIDKRSDSVEAELLYSYKLNPQTVFFLGYTTSGIENERLSGLGKTSDNVFVKLSYAWIQ